ncbi:MAG: VWA domain-containing protein [Acidobacteriota bacterium]
MKWGALAAALLCAFAQETVFKVDVKLVRVLATVKDGAGQLVGSLEKADFTILDNGVRQELAVFERHTEQPLSVAVLIDTSLSTGIELAYETESVAKFLKALVGEGNPRDTAALYSFSHDVTLRTGFTRRLERLEGSLKGLKPLGGTSLYDAIYLAGRNLDEREGRHVIVVVTDGGDTTSAKNYHDALKAAQLADAVLYAILVMPITNDPGRNVGGENALAGLAAGTGGRVFFPSVGAMLDIAFADILRELRTQYLLGYYPKNVPPSKDAFHRVEVRLSRPHLRALARNGYYEESGAEAPGWKRVR